MISLVEELLSFQINYGVLKDQDGMDLARIISAIFRKVFGLITKTDFI